MFNIKEQKIITDPPPKKAHASGFRLPGTYPKTNRVFFRVNPPQNKSVLGFVLQVAEHFIQFIAVEASELFN